MNFSFNSIQERLIKELSSLESFKTKILSSGVYARLIDVMSKGLELAALYGEILFKQATFRTTTIRNFIVAQAYLLGYTPHRKVGALGSLKFIGNVDTEIASAVYTGETVIVPKFTEFSNSGDGNVYSTEDVTYLKNTVIKHTTIDASSPAVDLGNNKIGIPVTAHGFPSGQLVTLRGTLNYDGNYVILSDTSTNQIVVGGIFSPETFDGQEIIFTGHVYVPVKQGFPKEFLYIASGESKEKIEIFSEDIENDILEIFIVDNDGNEIAPVNITSEPFLINDLTSYYAEVLSKNDFTGIEIIFGDDIYTRMLTVNERVLIKYADTAGAEGDILQTGVITTIKSTLTDLQGNIPAVYVTNDQPISGGKDYESIESIRANARNLFGAGYRASSKDDWEAIINGHPNVAKSVVWTDFDLDNTTISPNQNVVFITAISNSGIEITVDQQSDISLNYLKDKRSLTDIVRWEALKSIHVRCVINARVTPNLPFEEIQTEVFDVLSARYGILNAPFKSNAWESNVNAIIDNVDSIVFHNTEIWHSERSEDDETLDSSVSAREVIVSNPASVESDLTKQILLLEGNVEIWLRRKIGGVLQTEIQIAQTGAPDTILVGVNGFTISGGTVNYTTNIVAYNLTDIINDEAPPGQPDGATYGIQEWGFSSPTTPSSASGLLNDATVYTATINVDGGGAQPISIVGSASQTIQQVIDEINADLTGAVASFNPDGSSENGAILITSATPGTGSTILIADTDLFSSLTNANPAASTAVDGVAGGTFGVLNPNTSEDDGYFIRLVYKTKDGNGNYTNDIRLPQFYNITNLLDDDLFFTLTYLDT